MKRILYLFVMLISIIFSGCFYENKFSEKNVLVKLKSLNENEKRVATWVKNGVYVKGTTTILYTFLEFMELTSEEQNTIFLSTKAFIVYKDKYIDMFTFSSDLKVTASSFTDGTNGVKPVVGDSVIPITVTAKSGFETTSRNWSLNKSGILLNGRVADGMLPAFFNNVTIRKESNFPTNGVSIEIFDSTGVQKTDVINLVSGNLDKIVVRIIKDEVKVMVRIFDSKGSLVIEELVEIY